MQQAWEKFTKACPQGWQQKDIEQEWFRVLADLFPGKQPEAITPAEWGIALEQAPSKIVPF